MRILYYIYSLPVGGAETVVAEYLGQLRQRGVQVLLVQDYRTESFLTRSLEEQGIPMVTLWPGSGESKLGQTAKKAARGVGLYRRFNKVIREFQPDVIHFHAFPDHMDRLDFPRSRMFYSFHAALERNLSMLGQKNTALLQSLSDDGLTFCGLTSDYAKEIGARFHTDRVLCIPNGLDFDRIRSQRYSREELRSLFGIPEDAFLLGTVGRLHPVKNQERMLSILREVQKSRPDARLLIVGADQAGRADLLRRQGGGTGRGRRSGAGRGTSGRGRYPGRHGLLPHDLSLRGLAFGCHRGPGPGGEVRLFRRGAGRRGLSGLRSAESG